MKQLITAFLILVVCLEYVKNASLSAKEHKKYKNLIEGQGLYSFEDDVEVLTIDNFNGELYDQPHAWLIEFYNSWCGFCQRFAPSWKALASDTRPWKDLIKVGAIDCTNEDNAPICRDFEIMSYPTLRYFHENFKQDEKNYGVTVQKGEDMSQHKRYLIYQMVREQEEGRGKIFPNLLPYNETSVNKLFDNVRPGTKYVILIFEREGESFGPEVAMDLHSVKELTIRYTYPNNTALIKNARIEKFPSLIVMSDDKKINKFADGLKTRESMRMAIKEYLKPKDIEVPKDEKPTEIYTGKWLEAEVPDSIALMEAYEKRILKERIKKMKDVVFQMDLETALRWSLKREISRVKEINGVKLEALKKYLSVILKYFPLGSKGKAFITELKNKVDSKTEITGEEIRNFIKSSEENEESLFSSPEQWLGCEGSSPEHRGYPCGLWKMFHYLTVSAAEMNAFNQDGDPLEVLTAMEAYIGNFFGCNDCAQHFLDMVKKKAMKDVESYDSAILWLWMAHNSANKRLAGDATEDPEYPKMQFPSKENCPQCHDSEGSWNLSEVLKYIKQMYSSINVRYIGSDTRVLHAGLQGGPESKSSSGGGGGMLIDTSMLTILYLVSIALIVAVVFRMFIRRGYRKKRYVHDLLGKV